MQDVKQICQSSGDVAAVASGKQQQVFLPDRSAVARSCPNSSSIPAGAECASIHHIASSSGKASQGMLVLLSEKARGLTEKDRKWAAALAAKLVEVL